MMDRNSEFGEFFVDSISTDFSTLDLVISTEIAKGVIRFSCPRAFRVFAESDAYIYLKSYQADRVLYDNQHSKILTSRHSKYIREYIEEISPSRADDINYSCLVVTNQYCLEVIVFEDPEIEWE
jgi:hypothetical protein